MKDYLVLKSSRKALLRMAGYSEDHIIFKTSSPNQMLEFRVEGIKSDSGSPRNTC